MGYILSHYYISEEISSLDRCVIVKWLHNGRASDIVLK
jgi:hypothetical protein